MAVKEILLLGNPTLRAKCDKVNSFADRSVRDTVRDLSDTLRNFQQAHGFGRGISAPQIGIARRIVFISTERSFSLVNPAIIKRSKQMVTLWDDCFSFPDILVKVKRNLRITVSYQDEAGKKRRIEAEGSLSELLQHEIDHTDGILAIDRAVDSKHIILRSEWKQLEGSGKTTLY